MKTKESSGISRISTETFRTSSTDNFSLGEKLGVGAKIGGVVSTGRSAIRKYSMVTGKIELAIPSGYRVRVETINSGPGNGVVNLCDLSGIFTV